MLNYKIEEGFFNTKITGPGKVYIQSMPVFNTAQVLAPFMPSTSSSKESNGININFGNN